MTAVLPDDEDRSNTTKDNNHASDDEAEEEEVVVDVDANESVNESSTHPTAMATATEAATATEKATTTATGIDESSTVVIADEKAENSTTTTTNTTTLSAGHGTNHHGSPIKTTASAMMSMATALDDQNNGSNDDNDTPSNNHRRSQLHHRDSLRSVKLYGPPISRREGRRDHLSSLIMDHRITSSTRIAATNPMAGNIHAQAQEEDVETGSARIVTVTNPTNATSDADTAEAGKELQGGVSSPMMAAAAALSPLHISGPIPIPVGHDYDDDEEEEDDDNDEELVDEEKQQDLSIIIDPTGGTISSPMSIESVPENQEEEEPEEAAEDTNIMNGIVLFPQSQDSQEQDPQQQPSPPQQPSPSPQQQTPLAHTDPHIPRQRLYQRISVLLTPNHPSHLVQVRLHNVSYQISVPLDPHTKTTVINQSLCYFAYEFFRRFYNLMRATAANAPTTNDEDEDNHDVPDQGGNSFADDDDRNHHPTSGLLLTTAQHVATTATATCQKTCEKTYQKMKTVDRIHNKTKPSSSSSPTTSPSPSSPTRTTHAPASPTSPSSCPKKNHKKNNINQLIPRPQIKNKKYEVRDWKSLFVPYKRQAILRHIHLVFKPGKTYLLLGPPGSGKTSLLKAIAGLLPIEAVSTSRKQPTTTRSSSKSNSATYKNSATSSKKSSTSSKKSTSLTSSQDNNEPDDCYDDDGSSSTDEKLCMGGRIEYNGVDVHDDLELVLPNVVTYVGQVDVHAPRLTVKETFEFAYQSCNNPEVSHTQYACENLTIEGLGLDVCADTFVGNAHVRGVSGGQRRRVSVGEMMQGNSPVACCDEISTGLDAAVTHEIVESIVQYSRAVQTTRIISLLQPGPCTFALFDEVIVLCEGQVAYAGPVEDVVDYFAALGYTLPATVDVADFLQSVTTVDGALLFDPARSPRNEHYTADQFALAFQESTHGQRIQQQLHAPWPCDWSQPSSPPPRPPPPPLLPSDDAEDGHALGGIFGERRDDGVPPVYKEKFVNRWARSFELNFKRHLTLWYRDKGFIIGKAAENIGMAMATGGILFGRGVIPANLLNTSVNDWTSEDAVQLQTLQDGIYSALFMSVLHILLGTTTSAPDDLQDRPIHYKHGDANFYQLSAYLAGKLFASLPQRTIEICSFGIPLYWMVGLDPTWVSFFLYLLIILTYTFTLKLLYGIFAQLLPNQQNVLGFGTFMVLLFGLFSGFIVYPDVIPRYYLFLYYANPVAWAFQSLLLTEFTSGKYPPGTAQVLMGGRGFHYTRRWIGYNFAFFFPYAFACTIILVAVLRWIRIEPVRSGNANHSTNVDRKEKAQDFNFPFIPVDLTFENISYTVKASTGDEMIRILNGISGQMKAGRMCALMGSSGAGKTTLMDVISLRKTSGKIEGEVRLNGFLQERISFLRSSGYVEQFDVQQAELTVRETVMFSARLRLNRDNPVTATDEGRLKYVDYVLDMMELTGIAHLQVGSYEGGGLTFEQRKRLAIAVELAASPSVIFLDEPTSGLDSRGAIVIMRAMKKIADTGRTVCATIHQPSAAVFEMFDDLLLLKRGGEVVYFGELGDESCHLVEYFEKLGTKPIEHGENPAAWMLTAYTKDDSEHPTDWKALFEESDQYNRLNDALLAAKENPDVEKKITFDVEFAANSRTRKILMMRRTFHIMMRSPSYNLSRIMLAMLYALIIGTVFIGSQNKEKVYNENIVDGILSTIFLAMTIIGVVSISMAVPVMKQIRDVFYKHRASGMMDHNSVSISVTLGELPFILIMSAVFSVIYYSLVGLFGSANKWIIFFCYYALNIATYTYFGQAFICLVRDIPTASALVGALIGFNIFFSGLVVRPQYFVGMFLVGYYCAPGRYVYEGVITSQFINLEYPVVATPYSPFWYYLDCKDPYSACSGPMEVYVDFFFGGKFTNNDLGLILGVTFFCLALARFALWISLKKLNYVNT